MAYLLSNSKLSDFQNKNSKIPNTYFLHIIFEHNSFQDFFRCITKIKKRQLQKYFFTVHIKIEINLIWFCCIDLYILNSSPINKQQVADDPETLRIKQNTKIISNIAYHGDLEKKAAMEKQREAAEIADVRGMWEFSAGVNKLYLHIFECGNGLVPLHQYICAGVHLFTFCCRKNSC